MFATIARWHRAVELWCGRRPGLGPLLLRATIGGHLVWMTQDNVLSWSRMLEFRDFLAHHGFAWPLFCALLSVCAQFLCGLALVLGLCTRFAGLVIAVNFVVAIWMVDGRAPYPAAFPALSLVAAGLCLVFTGAGRWSLDRTWRRVH